MSEIRPWIVSFNPAEPMGSSITEGYAGRVTSPVSGAGLVTANTDPSIVGVDPLTGADAPTGTDVGFAAALRRFLMAGVYNGDFAVPPPDTSRPIVSDPKDAGYNPLDYWTCVAPANGSGYAEVVASAAPSGWSLRLTVDGAGASDEVFVRQIVPVNGSSNRSFAYMPAAYFSAETGAVEAFIRGQYLKADLTTTGSAVTDTATSSLSDLRALMGHVPADAYYLQLDVGARDGTGSATFTEVRCITGADRVLVPDVLTFTKVGGLYRSNNLRIAQEFDADGDPVDAYLTLSDTGLIVVDGNLNVQQDSTVSGDLTVVGTIKGTQLVPLTFSLINVPVGATTELFIGDTSIANSRIRAGAWGGSIVGMSYRLSAAVAAGTMSLQAWVGGSNVWTAFAAGLLAVNAHASQAPGTDTYANTDVLSVAAVTSAGCTANLDLTIVLWLLVDYDGT